MRFLLIHQIFLSAKDGGGTRHFEFARYTAQQGHDFVVIASDVSYLDGAKMQTDGRPEDIEGVEVRRARTINAINRSFIWRVVAFLSFMFSSVFKALGAGKIDVVMGTTPPIFQAGSAWLVAFLRRKPFLLEVRDLWPDFAVDMGILKNPVIIWLARRVELFLYARATHILVNSPAYRTYLVEKRGIKPEKVSVIPNGVDPSMFDPAEQGKALRDELNLHNKFIVTYAGAMGPANDIPKIIRAAEVLRDDPRIHFLMVGDGKDRKQAQALQEELGLTNVTFTGLRSKEEMKDILGASDACLATLMPIPMFKTVYPNKIFDYLAAGRPILLGIDGVIRDVVEAADAGVFIEPQGHQPLVDAVRRFADDPAGCKAMGLRGRAYVEKHFNRMTQAAQFVELIEKVAKRK